MKQDNLFQANKLNFLQHFYLNQNKLKKIFKRSHFRMIKISKQKKTKNSYLKY